MIEDGGGAPSMASKQEHVVTGPSREEFPKLGQLLPEPPWGEPPVHACGAQLASWLHRVVGRVVDVAVVLAPAALVWWASGSQLAYALVASALVLVVGWCNGAFGRSPGKRLIGLRLVRDADGGLPGGVVGVLRELAHVLDTWSLMIGWFFPLWDRKRQTFADKICGTVVVRADAPS
jgi:uncharacterized RDD family membrane protein YckC